VICMLNICQRQSANLHLPCRTASWSFPWATLVEAADSSATMMRKIKPLPSSSSPAGQAVGRSRCCRLLAGIKNARAFQGGFIVFFVFKRARQRCWSPGSCLFFFLHLSFADLVSPAAGDMLPLPSHASAVHGPPIPKAHLLGWCSAQEHAAAFCSIMLDTRSCF
jgi:hypothetical protein